MMLNTELNCCMMMVLVIALLLYLQMGKMTALSIIHGSPGPVFFYTPLWTTYLVVFKCYSLNSGYFKVKSKIIR